ncbi:Maf family protein [Shewanella ulleungensis]|jgi:MAF protein|uniref:7-methyl-GTP pyrophosphatase n=1 Tax=Shewanella ulleungensis TaxID=2282699 RepID=A0ABQ2QKZ9_9GAMM|nr:Maf family protein [Shewanella ulleungensis]MCL1151835.1 Maf-like protein [Shewanella ulleungensis]GGP83393.1 Maf-like protein [Shewanella ulleungensis]
MNFNLVLASTSPFRQQLLQKLMQPFDCVNPDIDETPQQNETATALVKRLAEQKALAGAKLAQKTDSTQLIIGSDQVAVINGLIIGKPHTVDNAIAQLSAASGQAITFYTGLAVYNQSTQQILSCIEPFTVHFKSLTQKQIRYYVEKEQPLYCAGSFKSEGLGIALFSRLEGDDPNTLIGLPLIKLIELLQQQGMDVLSR